MKLWLLRPLEKWSESCEEDGNPWHPWYDCTFGMVVRAPNEQAARQMAQDSGGFETAGYSHERAAQMAYRSQAWLSPEYSRCVELTPDGEPGIIIEDSHAA